MQVQEKTLTIAAGATTSSAAVDIGEHSIMALVMPTGFTGTALTFQAATNSGTFYTLYDDAGSQVSVTVADSRVIALDSVSMKLAPLQKIKIVSNATEASERTITLLLK